MDTEVLRQRLGELSDAAVEQAMATVQAAPDGQWIAASEWPVREIFAKPTRDSYREMPRRPPGDRRGYIRGWTG